MGDSQQEPHRRSPQRGFHGRDLMRPGADFDEDKALSGLHQVVTFNSLTDKWGLYDLDTLTGIPSFLGPERSLTRQERQRPYTTMCIPKGTIVRLYFFCRVEPGKLFTTLNLG